MTYPLIQVQELSKTFASQRDRYPTLRDRVAGVYKAFLSKNKNVAPAAHVYALRNISFTAQGGEAIGIVGSNGSGKSLLLKILSRITPPTSGHAQIAGKVSSLLDVGTGFHHDLTGRDNIFLNAAILGMRKEQIEQKYDSIVAFAKMEQHIDIPVKHYSSGMYVRLGFSIAAHLTPDIFFIDEILSVSDREFRLAALEVLQKFVAEGKIIFFVSHDLELIERLCKRVLWIEKGLLRMEGSSERVLQQYRAYFADKTEEALQPSVLR